MRRREPLLINTTHHKQSSQYSIRLNRPVDIKNGATISISKFSYYNSLYNISDQYGNKYITFKWIDGTVYNWIIPDGYYSVNDLNSWLQTQFITNNLYATNSKTSETFYFVQFVTNPVQYKNEIDVFYVPTATDATTANLTVPASATWSFASVRKLPIITINPNLKAYFGMSSRVVFGDESDQTKNYQYLSDITPTISPVFNILVTCNLAETYFGNSPLLIDQFPISASYGQLINYTSTIESNINVAPGIYNEIIVTLWDQNMMPLQSKDKDLTMIIILSYDDKNIVMSNK